jgi:hypothetical protein
MGPAAFPRDVGHAGRRGPTAMASRPSAAWPWDERGIDSSASDLRSLTNSSTDARIGGHLLDLFDAYTCGGESLG